MDKQLQWSSEYLHDQHYMSKELEQQAGLIYPVSPFYATTSPSASPTMIYGNEPFMSSPSSFNMSQHGPGSPDSMLSSYPPQLVKSCSNSTSSSYLSETIAKASALPESFYPEFLQYSKESFEQRNHNNKKRTRSEQAEQKKIKDQERPTRKQKVEQVVVVDENASVTELRRQIHIQSEQKRRAQIKDGFEDLRAELPACLNKKMSKVTLLHRTVQHIQHLKSTQMTILAELERLVQENEQLRSFQQSVLQKQALENMYSIGNM
ncbi:uncharacterized protein BX663DRAFT_545584 [Cokeromyces recurvatus]|uniref:uncharacterized protein n=1 Tax=Cokeromyces recurvatus TaxID=90255 RepID=UPI0022208C90|nr:uncharacterized protein BX663DRAFT_545584 [Cokeromyces recurvatus]KAI7899450.1 hypothetical protein BX663DRAFT_545584 [Cokeromyces recurvatus]